MTSIGSLALLLAAALVALTALAHLACVVLGGRAYRLLGAGERMARAVESGRWRPHLVTLGIAGVLGVWAAYALAGAGVIPALPMGRFVLLLIAAVFLARAFATPLLRPRFPENSETFWRVTSSVCLLLGMLYAIGGVSVWSRE